MPNKDILDQNWTSPTYEGSDAQRFAEMNAAMKRRMGFDSNDHPDAFRTTRQKVVTGSSKGKTLTVLHYTRPSPDWVPNGN